jgi:hypothetical protein
MNENQRPSPAAGNERSVDWQRPPFEPGNEAALKHGARSPRRVEEIANRISTDLLERAPWVASYPEALSALARAEAVTQLLFRDIATGGIYDKSGNFKASQLARWSTAENTASRIRSTLGLTPESEATVARDRASAAAIASQVDLQALAARGRAALSVQQPDLVMPAVEDVKAQWGAHANQTSALANEAVTKEFSKDDGDES